MFTGTLSWPIAFVDHLRSLVFFFSASARNDQDRSHDQALIKAALSGDSGFEKLVLAHEKMVYRVAFRFVGNEADASDITQEVFLKAHRALPRFRGESSLSSWLYTITANLSRNALRGRKNRSKFQVLTFQGDDDRETVIDKAEDKSASSHRQLESHDMGQAIQTALGHLPADFKEAVVLRDLEGLDYDEIARVLNLSVGTVKSRIARGRMLLREELKDWL